MSASHDLSIVHINTGYSKGYQAHLAAVEKWNKIFESINVEFRLEASENKDSEDKPEGEYYSTKDIELILDADAVITLLLAQVPLTVKSRYKLAATDAYLKNVAEAAERILQKMADFEAKSLPDSTFNSKCDVHVPGLGLLSINRTMLLEDSCTDQLETALANGWRIIAACPQPDQRRPDYILGKYDPDIERNHNESATRRATDK